MNPGARLDLSPFYSVQGTGPWDSTDQIRGSPPSLNPLEILSQTHVGVPTTQVILNSIWFIIAITLHRRFVGPQ